MKENFVTFENTVEIEKIKAYMKKHNLSEADFAKKCHLKLSQLMKILNNTEFFEPIWLLQIAHAMGVEFSSLVKP